MDSEDPARQTSPHLVLNSHIALSAQAGEDCRDLAVVAMSRTHMPMVVADARQPDLPIVLVNPAFISLTGYAAG